MTNSLVTKHVGGIKHDTLLLQDLRQHCKLNVTRQKIDNLVQELYDEVRDIYERSGLDLPAWCED